MSFGYSISTVALLKAFNQSVLTERYNSVGKISLIVEEKNRWYTYDLTSTLTADDDTIIAPTSNVGRWIGHGESALLVSDELTSATVNEIEFINGNVTLSGGVATVNLVTPSLDVYDGNTLILQNAEELSFIGTAVSSVMALGNRVTVELTDTTGGGSGGGDSWEAIYADFDAWETLYLNL